MTCTITVRMGNAAFADDSEELAGIIRGCACFDFVKAQQAGKHWLYDANGNQVGEIRIE